MILFITYGLQGQFQHELWYLGGQCKSLGIPVGVLGVAASEAVAETLRKNQQQLGHDSVMDVATTNNHSNGSNNTAWFTDADQQAWKIVIDYATSKMVVPTISL